MEEGSKRNLMLLTEHAVVEPQIGEYGQLLKAGKGKEINSLLMLSEMYAALDISLFWPDETFNLQNCKIIN